MVLLNVLVVANRDSRTLLGWEIIRCFSPEATFETDQVQLESCFVGNEKHQLDKTNVDLPIADVVATFGPYIKLFVSFADGAPDPVPRPPAMMLSQRSLSIPTIPSRIPSRSKKDDLYNALVGLFEQENLNLASDDAINGKRLLKSLTNALWYIDDRHETSVLAGFL